MMKIIKCIRDILHIRKPLHRLFIIDETDSEVMTMQGFDYADGTRKALRIWEPKNRYFIYGKTDGMEICKSHKECFEKVCSLCEDYEPLSSHAVLGEGWRDARKEPVPKDGKEYLLYTKTGIVSGWYCSDEDGTCFVCYDDAFTIEVECTEHGDYSEVTAWQEIVKPAFA